MAFGGTVIKDAAIASAASTSVAVNFGGRSFKQLTAYIPSMSTAAQITVFGSLDGSGTVFAKVFHPPINSSTVACNPMIIPSGVVTGGAIVQIPVAGIYGVRFVASDTVNNGLAIKVIGYD
jgi:hypothetical protein